MVDISKLPTGWSLITLGDLGITRTSNISPSDFNEEIFELWSVPIFPQNKPEILSGSEINSNKQTVKANDVLLCKINPRINRVWKVREKNEHTQIASTEWIIVRVPYIESDFLVYYFQAKSFREAICADVSGVGGSLIRARPKAVAKLHVKIPPLKEQKRIVTKIEALQTRSTAVKEELEAIKPLLNQFRQSVLASAFRGDLTKDWREQNKHIPWEHTTLESVIQDRPRNGYSPKAVDYPTKVKSFSLSATTSGIFKPEYFKYLDKEIEQDSYLWLKPGDILIQRSNTLEYVGTSAIYTGQFGDFVYPDTVMKVQVNEDKTTNKFVHYSLSNRKTRQYFKDNATGTAGNMPKINQKIVMNTPISLPAIEEQKEIVRRIESLFKLTDNIEQQYQQAEVDLETLNQSILAKAFRGELVPQNPNDEPASVLLERIKKERKNEITTKKSKTKKKRNSKKKDEQLGIPGM